MKTWRAWMLIILLLCNLLVFVPYNDNTVKAVYWDDTWSYYRTLTIDHTKIDNSLSGFPVLVVVPTAVGSIADDGDSLRFLDTDYTELPYEIEYFDASGDSFVWVNVTRISASTDTVFYMFYNNSAASDNQNPSDVWDVNYSGVYHMNGSSYDKIYDMTINRNDVTGEVGDPSYQQTGGIGYCMYFDGGDDYISGSTEFGVNDNCTIEVYAKADGSQGSNSVFDTGGSRGTGDGINMAFSSTAVGMHVRDAEVNKKYDKSYNVDTTIWRYAGFSAWDSTSKYQVGGASGDGSLTTYSLSSDLRNFIIGSQFDGGNDFKGWIDELRISNISRNASWLKASSYSVHNTLVSIGDESDQNYVAVTNPNPADDEIQIDAGDYGNYTHTIDVNESAHGRTMNLTWRWSSDGVTWYWFGENNTVNNGTYEMNNTGNFTLANHTYYWNVTVYDGYDTEGSLYTFTTLSDDVGNPTGVSTNYLNNELGFNWTLGYRNDYVVLVSNNGSYATSVGQTGSVTVYNNTGTSTIDTGVSSGVYYTLFGYNSTDSNYSNGVNINWGGMAINCYDEETGGGLTFDVFITDESGSSTYQQYAATNTLYLNLGDIPTGDNVAVQISANSSYDSMSEYFDGYQRDGLNRQNSTTTYIQLTKEPLNYSCVTVTTLNASGNTVDTPSFVQSGTIITIYPDASNEFDSVYINYTYTQYKPRLFYFDISVNSYYTLDAYLASAETTELYVLRVLNEYDNGVNDASITIRRFIDGAFRNVSILNTDGGGYAQTYLVSDILYKVIIEHSDYDTEYADFVPDPLVRTKDFYLTFITPSWIDELTFSSAIDFKFERSGTTLFINYSDITGFTSDVYVFIIGENYTTGEWYFVDDYSTTGNFSITVNNVNSSNQHKAIFYVNHSVWDAFSPYIRNLYVLGDSAALTSGDWLDNLFELNYGYNPIGWSNTFGFLLMCYGMFSFGQRGSGMAMVLTGFLLGFVNSVIGLTAIGVLVPALFILVGIMVVWANARKEGG